MDPKHSIIKGLSCIKIIALFMQNLNQYRYIHDLQAQSDSKSM